MRVLSIRAPRGTRVRVTCRGNGCRSTAPTRVGRSALRVRRLERRTYGSGAVLEVRVTRRGRLGKRTRFTFRRGQAPLRVDGCLAPNGRTAMACS